MNDLLPYIQHQLNDTLRSLLFFKPELCLTVLFLLVLLADLVYGKRSAWLCRMLSIMGMLVVLVADSGQYLMLDKRVAELLFNNNLLVHHSSAVLKFILDAAAAVLLIYLAWDNNFKSHPKGLSDAYTIIVGSVLGLHLMLMSATMLSMFLSVEMVSIASYLLVAYRSENAFSAEAGLKYVLFGMASSAVMLYGISLFYGFTGTISFIYDMATVAHLQQVDSLSVMFALLLIMVGVAFKLTLVPLHFWVPDVYQGASTPVMAYLSTLPKIAAFGMLANLLIPFMGMQIKGLDLGTVLSVVGIITMIAGNFAAVWQNNIKRMLAYSSIGHSGFALMAIVTFNEQGLTALSFYLMAYAIANIGTLALASFFSNEANASSLEDLRGLGIKYPAASVCFVVLLISLTGLPVSAGFNAKLLVFSSVYAVYQQSHDLWLLLLLITGALTTVVSLFYYIKIPLYLFLKKPEHHIHDDKPVNTRLLVLCVLTTVAVLLLGIFPDFIGKLL